MHYRATLTFHYRTPKMLLRRSKDVLVPGLYGSPHVANRRAYAEVVRLARHFTGPVLVLHGQDPPVGEPSRGTVVVIRAYKEVV